MINIKDNNININEKNKYIINDIENEIRKNELNDDKKSSSNRANINNVQENLIEIYSKKKSFSFLITLFIQIYHNKELCPLLMKKFYEMNININEQRTNNMDRQLNLIKYNSNMLIN